MSARDLMRALGSVSAVVAAARVEAVLTPFTMYAAEPRPTTESILQCFAAMASAQALFGAPERAVVNALDLRPAFDSAWWAELVNGLLHPRLPPMLADQVTDLCGRLKLLTGSLPRLARLLDAGPLDSPAILRLSLPHAGQRRAGLDRVAGAMDGVNHLCGALAELDGARAPVFLSAVEAGSQGTTLVLTRDSAPLEPLRTLLASIGEQVALHASMAPENRLTIIAPSLPIMDTIRGHANAPRMRTLIEMGVRSLIQAGCAWPAMPEGAPQAPDDLSSIIADERRHLLARSWAGRVDSHAAHLAPAG